MMESPSSSALQCFLAEARADHPRERGIQELSLGDQDAPSNFYQASIHQRLGISPTRPGNSERGERPASPKSLNLPAPGSPSRDSGSPITMESDMDLTANLLPSGGMHSHRLTLRTPVTESTLGPYLPSPSLPGSPTSQDQDKEGVSSCTFGSKALSLTSTLPFSLGTSRSIFLEPRKPLKGDPAPEKSWGQAHPWAGAPSLSPNSRIGPVPTTLPWVGDKPWTLPTDSSMFQREAPEAPRASPLPVGVMISKDATGMTPGGQGEPLDIGAELQGREQEEVSSEGPREEAGEGEDRSVDRRGHCKMGPQKLTLTSECWISTPKPSVEDSYGRQVREAGCMLLEWFRCLFLDSDNHSFSLLDSGLALTTGGLTLNAGSQEHPALRVAFLTMRNGRKLGMAFPGSNLFYYYSLGRHFFVTARLSNHWFRVRDRVTGEQMLMKKVPVVSDWQKMLHHFLFLPPGPGLLVPYAVLYDRQGSLLYLMEDPGVLTVGWPPAGQQLDRLKCLLEILRFLQFCQHHSLQLEEVDSGLLYTHQGIRFDPSGLSSNEGPYVFRKTLRNALRLVWNTPQEDSPAAEALLEQMWRWLEEDIRGHEEDLDEARASSLDLGTP
ncbi:uncharacterized protein LOC118859205 isoform X1 [Trichosurus vulpecula]|uniref:uncharacterized protein LOC118859205 isoform X1 n=1 Tax=Trichosurus vulpecula TaxID=9337 RepID=UPI00186B1A3A|nr:uncharacterized protein LOC118859205 isoform X1 [Trichosurus vulpecula]